MDELKNLTYGRVSVPTAHLPGFRTTIADKSGNLQRIMLRTYGGLGDQICAEPTIRYALHKFKDCEFFLDSEFPELFKHLHHKFKHIYKIGEDTVNYEKYFVFDMIKPPDDSNMVWQFMSHLLINCVDFPSLCAFRLQLPVADKEIVLTGTQPSLSSKDIKTIRGGILIHPGAHWPIKTFPAKFWESVTALVVAEGKTPVLIGGSLDDNRGTVPMNNIGCLDLRNKLKVEESIWCTQQAAVVLTNDSSPLHMAASGNAYVGYVATCKHPDMLMHWRHGQWAWREKNFGKDGIWNHLDYCPNKKNQLEVEEVPAELLESWLPDPVEFAGWALEKKSEYARVRLKEYSREWRLKNSDKCAAAYARRKERWDKDPDSRARRIRATTSAHMVRNYGITIEQRDEILASQNGLCKICGKTSKKFCVDHCHKTRKFRGVICDNCNKAIGHLYDDPTLAIKVSDYLALHSKEKE